MSRHAPSQIYSVKKVPKNIYIVTEQDGDIGDRLVTAFVSKKKATKYCKKHGEGFSFQKVKLK
jgi:hypothetical protein